MILDFPTEPPFGLPIIMIIIIYHDYDCLSHIIIIIILIIIIIIMIIIIMIIIIMIIIIIIPCSILPTIFPPKSAN